MAYVNRKLARRPFPETRIEDTRAPDERRVHTDAENLHVYPEFTKTAPPQPLYRYAREPGVFADVLAQLLVGIEKMQQILETPDVVMRLETILGWMRAGPASTAR
jgi:uncharacterized protein